MKMTVSEKQIAVIAKIPFRAEITWDGASVQIKGSLELIEKMQSHKTKFGNNPSLWPVLEHVKNGTDVLIQEFILKCRKEFELSYPHEELCHCRMVSTEKVFAALKEGLVTVDAIAEKTLAGTSCGSCRPDTLSLIHQFREKVEP